MKEKVFFLPGHAIKPTLAPGRGYCVASDTITIQGYPVGYMYREAGDTGGDSGWRFFSGTESEEFSLDAANFQIYDVNTIANYDPEIIPLLDAPTGSAFARESPSGPFVAVDFPSEEDLA